MKLVSISFTNFKGATASYDLNLVNLFVGRNFKGKTRVVDAIIILLLGHHPALGKQAKSTFCFSSGREMVVSGKFDTGQVIRRRFYLKGDSVKVEEELPEAWDQVVEQLPVMLDASLYFSKTDRERREYVFAHCPLPEGFVPNAIMARLAKNVPVDLGKLPEKIMEAVPSDRDYTAQEFLDLALERAGTIWKESKAAAERMEKTILGMSELRQQDAQGIPLATLETSRQAVTGIINGLMEERGRLIGAFTTMKSARVRRDEIDREIRFATKNAQELLEAREKLALLNEAAKASQPVTQAEMESLWSIVTFAKAEADMYQREANAAQKEKERAERLLAELDSKTCCPYCGATGDGWKALNAAELSKAIDEQAQKQADQLNRLKVVRSELELAVAAHTKARTTMSDQVLLERHQVALQQTIAKLEQEASRIKMLEDERARLMPDNAELNNDVETIQQRLNIRNDELRGLESQLKVAQGRKLELQRLAEAEKARDEAREEQAVAEKAGKELRVIQAEMVKAAFEPMLTLANSFFGGVLRAPLAYNHDVGGEIGMWVDGQWIGHHTFSGTEKALTYAAIQMALAARGPMRLMVLDELGRLDDGSVDRVGQALLAAVKAGAIDMFIGVDAGRLSYWRTVEANCGNEVAVHEIK